MTAPYMDWENYPDNYDFLSEQEKKRILDYLNVGEKYCEERHNQERIGYVRELERGGIAARYDWAGDRGAWILADQERAEMEWDWRWQCSD